MKKNGFLILFSIIVSTIFNLHVIARAIPVIAKAIPVIAKVRLYQDKKSSKIEIRLTEPIEKIPDLMASLQSVSFDLNAVLPEKKRRKVKESKLLNNEYVINSKDFISNVQLLPGDNKTTFEIKRQYFTPVNFLRQEDPPALIIEFPRNYFEKESVQLKPGIVKHLIRTVNERGPIVLHLLEIDLLNKNISFKVGMPNGEKIKAKETLTQIVKEQMAFAGINANYFDVKVGNPIGTLITGGTWVTGPVYDRVAIGFTDDNKVFINQVMLSGTVTAHRGFRRKARAEIEIDGLNTALNLYNTAGLFTKNWDEKIEVPKGKIALVVKNDLIKKIEDGNVAIPDDGYIIVGNKTYFKSVKKKDRLTIKWKSEPDWSEVKEAISGGPYLIMDGEVYVDEQRQRFKFAIRETFAPRSAIGIGQNGNLFLIAVDGRKPGFSAGLNLKELAEILKKLDLQEAINLDGGGSTTLVADGGIINSLSERHERKISNALLIFYK